MLSGHSVRTYRETSSHATCQGTLVHSRLSSLSHCRLFLAYRVELVRASWSQLKKKKKKKQAGNDSTKIFSCEQNATTITLKIACKCVLYIQWLDNDNQYNYSWLLKREKRYPRVNDDMCTSLNIQGKIQTHILALLPAKCRHLPEWLKLLVVTAE